MFDKALCYTGEVYVPEESETEETSTPASEGNESIAAPSPTGVDAEATAIHPDQLEANPQVSPHSIMQNAYAQASQIIDEAREKAQRDSEAIVAQAHEIAAEIEAQAINNAAAGYGLELWSSKHALSDVVQNALYAMLGEIGKDKAVYKAVKHAIKEQCRGKAVEVRADKRTADRLRLVELSGRANAPVEMFDIVTDNSIDPGRCVINAEGKLLEVDLKAQIEAIRSSCEQHVASCSNRHASMAGTHEEEVVE